MEHVGPEPDTVRITNSHETLIQSEGWFALVITAIPVVIAGAALAFSHSRVRRPALAVAAVILCLFALVSAASIGLLYIPSALLMIAAALAEDRPSSAPEGWI